MVATNKRSVDELVAHAKKVHFELLEWAGSPAERACVLALMQSSEMQLQTVVYIHKELKG